MNDDDSDDAPRFCLRHLEAQLLKSWATLWCPLHGRDGDQAALPHDLRVLLAELVTTSADVGSTHARSVKIQRLAGLLARLDAQEIAPAVSWLAA